MTLLLNMSSVGVNRESMENEDAVDGVGEEGDFWGDGLSLMSPRGRDGEGLSLSLDLSSIGSCELERSSVDGLGEV